MKNKNHPLIEFLFKVLSVAMLLTGCMGQPGFKSFDPSSTEQSQNLPSPTSTPNISPTIPPIATATPTVTPPVVTPTPPTVVNGPDNTYCKPGDIINFGAAKDSFADLPKACVFTAMSATPSTGQVIDVLAGGSLQTALNNANCGDTINLQAGAVFSGNFIVRGKNCPPTAWITIRTSAISQLPAEGNRITPCYAGVTSLPGRPAYNCSNSTNRMSKVQTPNTAPVFDFESNANHYRFIGLEIAPDPNNTNINPIYGFVRAQPTSTSSHHIIFDRVYIHGRYPYPVVRGIILDKFDYAAVIDSYMSDFACASVGNCSDTQTVFGGLGDYPSKAWKIVNNFLESSGENVFFGGGPATTTPVDIEVRRNHMFKPLIWLKSHPSFIPMYNGNPPVVKNLFELKNAQRVFLEANVLENSWQGFSQVGFGILITPKNQASSTGVGLCPLCRVHDITMRFNKMTNTGAGISIGNAPGSSTGTAANREAAGGSRYSVHNNLIEPLVDGYGSGVMVQLTNAWTASTLNSVSVRRNTFFNNSSLGKLLLIGNDVNLPHMYDLEFMDNVAHAGPYPVWSSGGTTNCAYGNGPDKIAACFNNSVVTNNVIIGNMTGIFAPAKWPTGNFFPLDNTAVGFINFTNGDYKLMPTSPYAGKGTGGRNPGVDIDALNLLLQGVY